MSDKLKLNFINYHAANPQVYEAFKRFTFQAVRHRKNFSSKAIFERLRWDSMIAGDDGFKMNNNYTPYYARLFEADHPQHKGFFRKRGV